MNTAVKSAISMTKIQTVMNANDFSVIHQNVLFLYTEIISNNSYCVAFVTAIFQKNCKYSITKMNNRNNIGINLPG